MPHDAGQLCARLVARLLAALLQSVGRGREKKTTAAYPVEQFYLRFFAQQTTLQSQNRQLKQTLANRERALKACRSEIDAIHSSFTYRIGRVITWLPRMLRKILRKTHCTPVDT